MKRYLSILSCFVSFSIYAQINVQSEIEKSFSEKSIRSLHKLPVGTRDLFAPQWDSTYIFQFKSENDSILSKKIEYGYDSGGRYNMLTEYNRDPINNKWIGLNKYAFDFDEEGNELSHAFSKWNAAASQWQFTFKQEVMRNEDGKIYQDILSSWDTVSSEWIYIYRTEYEYNENSKLQTHSTWNKESGSWGEGIISTVVYEYNEHGKETRAICENSSLDSTRWYDSGNKLSESHYSWNSTENKWLGSSKSEYFDYINDTYTRYIFSVWDPASSDWINNRMYLTTYTPSGHVLSQSLYFYDLNSNDWIPSYKSENIYYESGVLKMEIEFLWDNSSNYWSIDKKGFCYYSYNFPSGLDQNTKNSIRIYPNPAHSELSLEIGQNPTSPCLLINVQGNVIHTFKVTQGLNILNIEGFPAGLYFIRFQNDPEINEMKVIIE